MATTPNHSPFTRIRYPDPDPQPVKAPVTVSSNPLLALIAQGLEDMGFKATTSVSQESIAAMVQEAVTAAMRQYQ